MDGIWRQHSSNQKAENRSFSQRDGWRGHGLQGTSATPGLQAVPREVEVGDQLLEAALPQMVVGLGPLSWFLEPTVSCLDEVAHSTYLRIKCREKQHNV